MGKTSTGLAASTNDPNNLTGGISLGGNKKVKDPTGWSAAQSSNIDTSGMGIAQLTGPQTFANLYQAIEADATQSTSGGKLWAQFKTALRIKGNGYSKDAMGAIKWVPHDGIALKNLLTTWNATNNTLTSQKQPTLGGSVFLNNAVGSAKNGTSGNTVTHVTRGILSAHTASSHAEQVATVLNQYVLPRAKALGSNLSTAQLNAIAENALKDGSYQYGNILDETILKGTNVGTTLAKDETTAPLGGAIGNTNDAFHQTAMEYGIPVPSDPKQFGAFVKGAVGPGGTADAFTEYAKNQAKLLYPWMATSLDAGATVSGYLQPFKTVIANTLGNNPNEINWTDPKWQSVVAKKDANGLSIPQTLDQATATIKNDPRFGYDSSVNGINAASDLLANVKSMFGFGG